MARILVVDDSAGIRLVMGRLLGHRGHETRVAATGFEAMRMIAQQPFDLVLLDISMPAMDGLSVLEALCGENDRPIIPVIIMSAQTGREERSAARRLGAADYLVKGEVAFSELETRLERCLAKR